MASSKGGRAGYIAPGRIHAYERMRAKGMSKKKAARIANAGRTHGRRSRMAKKAARTRRAQGRKK